MFVGTLPQTGLNELWCGYKLTINFDFGMVVWTGFSILLHFIYCQTKGLVRYIKVT